MGIGDILEGAGNSFDPSIGTSPYIPKAAAGIAGVLSGFSAGRAARRKLGAADKIRRLEDKLGFPIDVLSRMSPAVQSDIMQRAGFGADTGMNTPMPQYEGYTMGELMKQGAPASTAAPPEGTGVFSGVPGGPQQDLSRQELPRQITAMPPLGILPESQAAGELSARFGGGAAVDPYKEAQTRAANLLGDVRQGQLEQQPAEARLTESKISRLLLEMELAKKAAADLYVPEWALKQFRLGGIQIPAGQPVSHKTLDDLMANASGYQEYLRMVEETTPTLVQRATSDPKYSKIQLREDVRNSGLSARLQGASLRIGPDKNLLNELFVERVWSSIQASKHVRDTAPVPNPGAPYTVPGYQEGQ